MNNELKNRINNLSKNMKKNLENENYREYSNCKNKIIAIIMSKLPGKFPKYKINKIRNNPWYVCERNIIIDKSFHSMYKETVDTFIIGRPYSKKALFKPTLLERLLYSPVYKEIIYIEGLDCLVVLDMYTDDPLHEIIINTKEETTHSE